MTKIEIDNDIYAQAEELLEEIGLDVESSVRVFLKKVIDSRGIPFDLKVYKEKPTPLSPPSSKDTSQIPDTQAGRLYRLMKKLHREGTLGEDGLFKTKIEEYYHREYPEDNPKDISQALSDGCSEKYAGKLGVVYERVIKNNKTRTGIYRLKTQN